MNKLFENWRKYLKEGFETAGSSKESIGFDADNPYHQQVLQIFDEEKYKIISSYNNGQNAANMQKLIASFYQKNKNIIQKDIEAAKGIYDIEASANKHRSGQRRLHGRLDEFEAGMYRQQAIKASKWLEDGTAYKKLGIQANIVRKLSELQVTLRSKKYVISLYKDDPHTSGRNVLGFYSHGDKEVAITEMALTKYVDETGEGSAEGARDVFQHELEHAVSHIFEDSVKNIRYRSSYPGYFLMRAYKKLGWPREDAPEDVWYFEKLAILGDIQLEKLRKIYDPKRITPKKQGPEYGTDASGEGGQEYFDRTEELRAFAKEIQHTFPDGIPPKIIQAICKYKALSDGLKRAEDEQNRVMARTIASEKARALETVLELFPNFKRLESVTLYYLNCRDPAATAKAINTLAKVEKAKTPSTAE
jgi:hypothetical protein